MAVTPHIDAADEEVAAVVDDLLTDRQVLGGSCDGSPDLADALWRDLEHLELTRVGVSEDRGGSGGSVSNLLTVVRVAAHHGAPLPLAESYLADALLASAMLPGVEAGFATTLSMPLRVDGSMPISLPSTPWGERAARAVVLLRDPDGQWQVGHVDPRQCSVLPGRNLAGEPVADLTFAATEAARAPMGSDPGEWWWLGALCRTAQITGALESTLLMTRRYVSERVQFGKPIGSFQAVQRHIVDLAEAVQMASMALRCATEAWLCGASHRTFEVCAAKLVANEAARDGARAAHQAHGAMGMTREYPLHRLTSRLAHWQFDFGTEKQLASSLGAATHGAESFSHAISDYENHLEVPCPVTSP